MFNPGKKDKNRRSIRLKNFDYSQAGYYFVTVCVDGRRNLFGDIEDGKMALNDAGFTVQAVWNEIPKYYDDIGIDILQIMPNHIHGIIIVGAGPCACPNDEKGQPQGVAPTIANDEKWQPQGVAHTIANDEKWQPQGVAPTIANDEKWQPRGVAHTIANDEKWQPQGVAPTLSLGDIVGRFKSLTTTKYINGIKNNNWPPFKKYFWQRNYYEHVIRDDNDLNRIREYIVNNPAKWQEDEYYMDR